MSQMSGEVELLHGLKDNYWTLCGLFLPSLGRSVAMKIVGAPRAVRNREVVTCLKCLAT